MMQDTKLYTALALTGTIPFLAGALLPLLGHESLPYLGPLDQVVASYGLAIVCFLAAWFASIGAALKTAIGVQIIALLTLLFIDLHFRTNNVISATYFRARAVATLIATVSLLVVIAQ